MWEKSFIFSRFKCVICGERMYAKGKKNYRYRKAYIDISGHNQIDYACKECIENK